MNDTQRKDTFLRLMLPILIIGGTVMIFQYGFDFGKWLQEVLNK